MLKDSDLAKALEAYPRQRGPWSKVQREWVVFGFEVVRDDCYLTLEILGAVEPATEASYHDPGESGSGGIVGAFLGGKTFALTDEEHELIEPLIYTRWERRSR